MRFAESKYCAEFMEFFLAEAKPRLYAFASQTFLFLQTPLMSSSLLNSKTMGTNSIQFIFYIAQQKLKKNVLRFIMLFILKVPSICITIIVLYKVVT
jgi:hypothetical protein